MPCCHRFGAEDLFKAAEEGSAERSRRLLEEDIDDILSRAEVVTQQPGQQSVAGGASDLLSSFNVATFKVWRRIDSRCWWQQKAAGQVMLTASSMSPSCRQDCKCSATTVCKHSCSQHNNAQQWAVHATHMDELLCCACLATE